MIGNLLAGMLNKGPVLGDFESIATSVVGSGGAADVTFSSIPATYQHLQIRIISRTNRSNSNFDGVRVQLNSDTGSNYAEHGLYGDGASAFSFAGTNQTSIQMYRAAGNTAGSNTFGTIVLDILDYSNTNKFKTFRYLGGLDNNGSGEIYLGSGLWRSTSAISSIKFYPSVGTLFNQYTQIALYGIKG